MLIKLQKIAYFLPVIEEAGEARLALCLVQICLAVFNFGLHFAPTYASRCLYIKAHLHIFHTEALQTGLALFNAGHRLHTSSQLHLTHTE